MARSGRSNLLLPLVLTLMLAVEVGFASAATITIVNRDGPGEGFNDPTPATPVGGNLGTTLGAQRLNVFEAAGSIWGSILPSSITIRVQATFDALACNASQGVLGSTQPLTIVSDFSGARFPGTWYHVALANKLAGRDLAPSQDDIRAQFNSSVDNSTCLGSVGWYYGLDHNHGTNVDLLAVVLHELAHGLGFSSFVDPSSGEMFNGTPDIFSHFILDATTGKRWSDMTDAERRASAINTRRVVWDGAAVALRAPSFLGPRPRVLVNAPAAIAGDLEVLAADFGPPPPASGVRANVVLVENGNPPTSDACSAIVNAAQVRGHIALIDRGNCPFASKAARAQAAGAVGVLIANDESGPPAAIVGSDPSITIPVMGITQEDGNAIKTQLGNAVNATIGLDPAHLAGANDAGKVLLYMPKPVEVGSSVSHWDPSATPDLIMEPFLTEHLTSDVDLTRAVFEDIGWFSTPTGGTNAAVRMLDNYPNPFRPHDRPQTTLQFELDRATTVELGIYDMGGRLVRRLFEGALGAGNHTEFSWDGSDDQGRPADSGVYLCRARAGKHSSARRVTVVR